LPGLAAMALGALIPMWLFPVLRFVGRLPAVDAAAISAHYGSVSAVTFIAATNYLKAVNEPFPEYASAFLAVMEAPAILVGVVLGKVAGPRTGPVGPVIRRSLHEAVTGRSVLLLVGALVAGWASGKKGGEATAGFFVTPFQGVLALFLLETLQFALEFLLFLMIVWIEACRKCIPILKSKRPHIDRFLKYICKKGIDVLLGAERMLMLDDLWFNTLFLLLLFMANVLNRSSTDFTKCDKRLTINLLCNNLAIMLYGKIASTYLHGNNTMHSLGRAINGRFYILLPFLTSRSNPTK
jgi:hypothetical protein